MTCDHGMMLMSEMMMLMLMKCSWLTCKLTLGVLHQVYINVVD